MTIKASDSPDGPSTNIRNTKHQGWLEYYSKQFGVHIKTCIPDQCKFKDKCKYKRENTPCGIELEKERELRKNLGDFLSAEMFNQILSFILWTNRIDDWLALQDPDTIFTKYFYLMDHRIRRLQHFYRICGAYWQKQKKEETLEEYLAKKKKK
ncbi:MAG: hypothetical protein AB1349_01515 [Elusimicrobiota bacterium]